ncbi:MAG: hypothetical protein KIT35_18165 [Piscinibacter sp.]|uniref:hypothetical protein n=1 Tax=Piscinibacter TaxID=1114981 RepID=UPI000FDD7369|nr:MULTISPECIES: hypothetical protein [Piscinibacter]MCW5665759.1 hypothetical protein [Piscinibacter sp.]
MQTRSRAPIAALYTLTALAALTSLGACGGGGSDTPAPGNGGGQTPAPPPPPADFTLTLSTDRTLVIQGRTAELTATVTRRNGFTGAVLVSLKNLPAGVSAAPVMIAAGATSAPVTLAAAAGAPHSLPTAGSAEGSSGELKDTEPLTVTVGGEPGVLDTSFNGGKQIVAVGDGEAYATAMAVQADGKVITVGRTTTIAGGTDFAVLRHGRDGTLDTTFGSGGKVVTAIAAGNGSDMAQAVAVQPDGKILVAGTTAVSGTDIDFAIVRYLADGTLDPSFGNGGKVVTSLGNSTDHLNAIALQEDGKIVVAGDSDRGSSSTGVDFALVRYQANGALDNGFGNGGTVITPIRAHSSRDSAYALLLQKVGTEQRIVAVGGEGDFVAARYTASGALDAGFGTGGKVAGVFGHSTIGAAQAVVLAGGKLVLAGQIQNDFALARLNADGSLDAGFGSGGTVITPVSATNWDAASALVRQADGKLLAGGWVYEGGSSSGNFAVARYGADGALDTTFGTQGLAITPMASAGRSDSGRAVVLQADPRVSTVRLLQAGEANEGGGFKFALLRRWL